MLFGLKNAPPTYLCIVNQIFKEYLGDFSIYSDIDSYLWKLWLVFDCYGQYGISLNSEKYIFYVSSRVILSYIVRKEGKFLDPKKIKALVDMPTSKDMKAIQTLNRLAFNCYFIKKYIAIMEPVTRLRWKN